MEKSNYVDTPRVTLEQAKAIVETKTAPRITEQFLKDQVAEATYLRHKHMTICVMELANGFFVTGKAAPADPANYDSCGSFTASGSAARWHPLSRRLDGFRVPC